jgi:hypothetical protein
MATYLQQIVAALRINKLNAAGRSTCIGNRECRRSFYGRRFVMATHSRTGPQRTLLASVAGEVMRHSPTAVIVVRPAKLHGAEQGPVPG